MKKCLLTIVSVLLISSFTYAVDFSIGATAGGWGPTFGRGDSWKEASKIMESKAGMEHKFAFAPAVQVITQVDFIPYFGIELGVGYSTKNLATFTSALSGIKYSFTQLSIPLLLKGQYEIADRVNIYLGVGPKFNFNIAAPSTSIYVLNTKITEGSRPKEAYNMFDMDLSFALGAEYKIAGAHYIGLRVGYDMNLLGSINYLNDEGKFVKEELYVDNLAFSLTYRYKFGQ